MNCSSFVFWRIPVGAHGSQFGFAADSYAPSRIEQCRGLTFVKYFPELRLIVNSLVGSLAGLMWSIIMMLLIFFVFALFFVQGAAMHLYLHRGETTPGDIGRVMSEFGSVEKALLALYRAVTGGEDWSVFYRVVEVTGPLYTWLFIFFIAFSHIAFLNILTATFVNKASRSRVLSGPLDFTSPGIGEDTCSHIYSSAVSSKPEYHRLHIRFVVACKGRAVLVVCAHAVQRRQGFGVSSQRGLLGPRSSVSA